MMFLAAVPEATEPSVRPYVHPHLPDPEQRSRVVGYLRHAPEPTPGYRTDGDWVWPLGIAQQAADHGVGPPAELLEHMGRRGYLLPESVPAAQLVAARQRAGGEPTPAAVAPVEYLTDPVDPAVLVRRCRSGEGDSMQAFTPLGWRHLDSRAGGYLPVATAEVGGRLDELCVRWHAAQLAEAAESGPPATGIRLARMFDGVGPSGRPWFSPGRRRILEAGRRERLAAYLGGARLVIRSTSRMPDPLGSAETVRLGFRTDGVWVWQEALAHYVRRRGAAPELALLTHIERCAYRLPPTPSAETVQAAVAAVRLGPAPPPNGAAFTYLTDSRRIALARIRRDRPGRVETLGPDLRWGYEPCVVDGMAEITEAEAVQLADGRWAVLAGASR